MILEQNIPSFWEWFFGDGWNFLQGQGGEPGAVLRWLAAVGILLGVALLASFILCLIRYGFAGVVPAYGRALRRAFENITSLSIHRIWAIARLTMKESIRRRVLLIFALFMVILLVAAWYLDAGGADPAKLYISFVFAATTILILLLTLFLSTFSLPSDFKNKTIYSVVTKPVRSSELVFGRILGVGLIGTIILLLMAVSSYLFVTNGLQHTHLIIEGDDIAAVSLDEGITSEDAKQITFRGDTRINNGHKHPVTVHADGTVRVGIVNGHTHPVRTEKVGDKTRYIVGIEQGTLQARVPVRGKLSFRGSDGMDKSVGINVGHEWEYRSYIGVDEAAIFTFSGIHPSNFPENVFTIGIPVEMTLGVFRTHKGDIEKGVRASLAVRNPKTGLKVEVLTFHTEEFITKSIPIPRTFEGTPQLTQRRGRIESKGDSTATFYAVPDDTTLRREQDEPEFNRRRQFDFFKDFVADGQFEIWLQCIDNQQYVGVAEADLYLRSNDASVAMNFVKGFYGIWMRMIVITAFGVLFSTFLSGPVAMISTVGVMIAGFTKGFMIKIGLNEILGGGPFESLYRLLTQENMVTDLPQSFATTFIKSADWVYSGFMLLLGQAIPPLSDYTVYDDSVTYGFNIPGAWLANHTVMTFAYALPIFLVAYLILSNREVAK